MGMYLQKYSYLGTNSYKNTKLYIKLMFGYLTFFMNSDMQIW